jgi:hypothetical protein
VHALAHSKSPRPNPTGGAKGAWAYTALHRAALRLARGSHAYEQKLHMCIHTTSVHTRGRPSHPISSLSQGATSRARTQAALGFFFSLARSRRPPSPIAPDIGPLLSYPVTFPVSFLIVLRACKGSQISIRNALIQRPPPACDDSSTQDSIEKQPSSRLLVKRGPSDVTSSFCIPPLRGRPPGRQHPRPQMFQ